MRRPFLDPTLPRASRNPQRVEQCVAGHDPDSLLLLHHARCTAAAMAARPGEAPGTHLARVATLLPDMLHPAPSGPVFQCLAQSLSPVRGRAPCVRMSPPGNASLPQAASPAEGVPAAPPPQVHRFWALDRRERDAWTHGLPTAASIPAAADATVEGATWLAGATVLRYGTPVGPLPLQASTQEARRSRLATLERLQRAQAKAQLALAELVDALLATGDPEPLHRARQLLHSLHAQHDHLRRRVARARVRGGGASQRRRQRPAIGATVEEPAYPLADACARVCGAVARCLAACAALCLCVAAAVVAMEGAAPIGGAGCILEPMPGPV